MMLQRASDAFFVSIVVSDHIGGSARNVCLIDSHSDKQIISGRWNIFKDVFKHIIVLWQRGLYIDYRWPLDKTSETLQMIISNDFDWIKALNFEHVISFRMKWEMFVKLYAIRLSISLAINRWLSTNRTSDRKCPSPMGIINSHG